MEDKKPIPSLYILMRTDLASMNAGKAIAQGSHAANDFVHYMHFRKAEAEDAIECEQMVNDWMNETGKGFGTAIVLAVNESQMRTAVNIGQMLGFHAGITHDPTYPLRDGETVHLIPLDTCAWVFVPDKDDPRCKMLLGNFPLHP